MASSNNSHRFWNYRSERLRSDCLRSDRRSRCMARVSASGRFWSPITTRPTLPPLPVQGRISTRRPVTCIRKTAGPLFHRVNEALDAQHGCGQLAQRLLQTLHIHLCRHRNRDRAEMGPMILVIMFVFMTRSDVLRQRVNVARFCSGAGNAGRRRHGQQRHGHAPMACLHQRGIRCTG